MKQLSKENIAHRARQAQAREIARRTYLIWDSYTKGTYVRKLHGPIGQRG